MVAGYYGGARQDRPAKPTKRKSLPMGNRAEIIFHDAAMVRERIDALTKGQEAEAS